MHPVPMDGTDGKVANEPSRVRVSVVEPSGTWTFGLGKNRDLSSSKQDAQTRFQNRSTHHKENTLLSSGSCLQR